ncbi:MAG: phosphopantothenate/pantothenate synthetase family protein, partial [Halobacteriales archaeon]
VVVDLNPMSRSARDADVPVVDNVVRAFPRMTEMAREMEDWNEPRLRDVVEGFDAQEVLARAERAVRERAVEAGV